MKLVCKQSVLTLKELLTGCLSSQIKKATRFYVKVVSSSSASNLKS